MRKEVFIIIPVYNNAATLVELNSGIVDVCTRYTEHYQFRLLYVNDASTDGSERTINGLETEGELIVEQLVLEKNVGQVQAILNGLAHIEREGWFVLLSADMQDPPEIIARLLTAYEAGVDMVVAARKKHYTLRSEWFHRLIYLFYKDYPITGFDVVLLNEDVRQRLIQKRSYTPFLQVEMLRASRKTRTIYYDKLRRRKGFSQWSLQKRMDYLLTFLYHYTWIKWMLLLAVAAIAIIAIVIF